MQDKKYHADRNGNPQRGGEQIICHARQRQACLTERPPEFIRVTERTQHAAYRLCFVQFAAAAQLGGAAADMVGQLAANTRTIRRPAQMTAHTV